MKVLNIMLFNPPTLSSDIMKTREDLFKKYLPSISGLNDIMGGPCKPQPGKYSLQNKVRNFESARAKALNVAYAASEVRKRKKEKMVMLDIPSHDPNRVRRYKSSLPDTGENARQYQKNHAKRIITTKGVTQTKHEIRFQKSKVKDAPSTMNGDGFHNTDDKAEYYHKEIDIDNDTAEKEKPITSMESLESKIKALQSDIQILENSKRNNYDFTEKNIENKQNGCDVSEDDLHHEELNDEPYICVLTGAYSSPYPVVGGTSYENYIDNDVTAGIVIPDALKGKPYKPTRLNNQLVFISKGVESADEYRGERRKCYLYPACNIEWEPGTRISKVVILEGKHSLLGMSVWACLHHGQASMNGYTRQIQGIYWPYKYANKNSICDDSKKDGERLTSTNQRRTKRRES